MEIIGEDVTFKGSDGTDVIAYASRPRDSGSHPGIMVVHEVFGLTEHVKDVTRRLAKEGFVAFAPHLYSRQDFLTEKNIAHAFFPMFTITTEKMNDPASIES